jgi:MFS family permease
MEQNINRSGLFWASCVALIVTAMTFGIRAGILGTLGQEFNLSGRELGIVTGTAFWGFTLAMMFGGPLCDVVGMKRLILIAFVGHVIGIALTIVATGFWSLFISTLVLGISNGMVEAACNPLVTSLYPNNKTEKLNLFHFWYPGGIVIGTLIGYFLQTYYSQDNSWQLQMGTMLIPTVIYGVMFLGKSFPVTERVSSGVSTGEMFRACLNPLFLFMIICMFITASTEFGVNNWVPLFLQEGQVNSLLLLTWVALIMALGRLLLGPIVHSAVAPEKALLFSAIASGVGIYWLSYATGYSAFAAAAVFGIGVSFFWPTMLGFVSEYLPRTGALGLALMGGAGMLCVAFALPVLGGIYDEKVAAATAAGAATVVGGAETLRTIIVLPIFLILAFAGLVFYMRNKKKPSLATSGH